jgi:Ca2+-dependent lipid-binding protein
MRARTHTHTHTHTHTAQVPPRIDGIKVYEQGGDELVLMEVVVAWGSNLKVRVFMCACMCMCMCMCMCACACACASAHACLSSHGNTHTFAACAHVAQVTVGATVTLLGHIFRIPLTVQRLQIHTRVRVSAQVTAGACVRTCVRARARVWRLFCKGVEACMCLQR